eukprot:1093647-Rhodomonas_salina.1
MAGVRECVMAGHQLNNTAWAQLCMDALHWQYESQITAWFQSYKYGTTSLAANFSRATRTGFD